MVAFYNRVRRCLVECDLVGDKDIVAVVAGGFPVVYFGADYRCSIDDYEVGFVVVKSFL